MIKFIQKKMNKDGFTLVELIIVIAVMAILAAIVVPRMSGITDSFKVKADERYMTTIARDIEIQIQNGTLAEVTAYTNIPVYISGTTFGSLGELIETPASAATSFFVGYDGTNVYVYATTGSAIATNGTAPTEAGTISIVVTKAHGGVID